MRGISHVWRIEPIMRKKFFRRSRLSELVSDTEDAHWDRIMLREKFCDGAPEASGRLVFFESHDTSRTFCSVEYCVRIEWLHCRQVQDN